MTSFYQKNLFKVINEKLLFLNIFFLQSYQIKLIMGGYPTNLQEILILLNLLAFLINKYEKKNLLKNTLQILIKNLAQFPIIATLGFLTIFATITNFQDLNFIDLARQYKFLGFSAIYVYIFLSTLNDRISLEKAFTIYSLGALAYGFFSIIYNLSGYNVALDHRLLGSLDSAVYLAYYLAPAFIWFFLKFINKKEKENLIYLILIAIPLVGTQSMGAFLAIFLAITFFIIKKQQKRILNNKSILLTAALIFFLLIGAITTTKILPTLKYGNTSLSERGEIWQTAITLLLKPQNLLTGIGPGQFDYQFKKTVKTAIGKEPLDYNVIQPHNILLIFTLNYGILGLIMIIFLILKTLKFLYKKSLNNEYKEVYDYTNIVLIYFFTHGMIDTPIFKNDLLLLFLLFLECQTQIAQNNFRIKGFNNAGSNKYATSA